MEAEVKQQVREFIRKNLVVFEDGITFTDEDNIFQMGFVNSLFAMKLLNYLEQEMGVTVDDDDLEISNFSSVNNIFRLIQKKKAVENV